jgi:hypothetical protein
MVGKTGFEPATLWSQTRCATKLRHFPMMMYPERLELAPQPFQGWALPTELMVLKKYGGQSGIRTHETSYPRLHDFQSCSFDQLGHLSILSNKVCIPQN